MTTGSSDVVVVGAGLAGLAAAQLCRRRGLVVTVFDQHPGGRARSDRKDGFVFNRGPHAIYRGGATERVLRELGVTYSGGPPALASGAILVDGRQFAMPATKSAVLTSRYFATRDKVTYGRFFTRLARMDAAQFGGVTVSEMLGDLTDRAAKVALMAVRTATYAHAPDVMSAEVAITALQAPGVLYIDDGWQHLVDSLAEGIDVRSESVVTINGGVVTTGVGTYEAPMAIVAVGSPAAAARVLGRSAFDVDSPIEVACLDLGVDHAPTKPVLMAIDEPIYLSCHTPMARLAPPGCHVVHVARYLAPGDDDAPDVLQDQLRVHAARNGITEQSIVSSRYLHRMMVSGALVTAARGGFAGRPAIDESGTADVFVVGDWVGPEGQLADAAFASAYAAALRVCAKLKR